MKKSAIIFAVLLAFVATLRGEIIYTDVNPDKILKGSLGNPWDNYMIDLDCDKDFDFVLTHFYPSEDLFYTEFQTTNQKEAEILVDDSDHPQALKFDDPIGVNQNKWLSFASFAIHVRENWKGATDKFLAVRMIKSGMNYYGWIRLDIPSDESNCTIKDFACQSEANTGIKAGEGIATGINGQKQIDIDISPNPASDFIIISNINNVSTNGVDLSIRIFNALGECVLDSLPYALDNSIIDIYDFPVGPYYFKSGDVIKKFMVIK